LTQLLRPALLVKQLWNRWQNRQSARWSQL
jgi:hypothetical protein